MARRVAKAVAWLLVALAGAAGYAAMAAGRGETVNSFYLLLAALCTYAIGYRFYGKWIAAKLLALDDRRATPAVVRDDGKDYVKTNRWIVFGHHFAAISGPGPLVGPVLAAQFGFLPGTLWILIGVVLGGAVQDFVILFGSMRRDGRSLAQMVREELNRAAGWIGTAAVLSIMVILLAVLGLVVVKALAESPWGVFTVAATIPIAMFMGGYLRYFRVGRVLEVSAIGAALLLLAVWGGQFVHSHPAWAAVFKIGELPLAWAVIVYGLAASVVPVWLLLAPRDYLSTFMKLGTIFALAVGVLLVLPDLRMPAVTAFADGSGPVVAGKLFPFCFITIACGAISGFHTLIASGTTPKIIPREGDARMVGYGAMCLESLVAVMAMIAACTLDPGVYLAMNIPRGENPALVAGETVAKVNAYGPPFRVTEEAMATLAADVGEQSLYGRTGGAATLAVGMAQIFSRVTGGRWLDLWYHFAIMFEALFILTTLDAGTRVGRYLLQDMLGNFWKPLGDTGSLGANLFASSLVVGAWGYFLVQGVRDPLGGINSLWPLFGIANQLLAAIALCLATTIILKQQILRRRSPAVALVTLVPLLWLGTVTVTAGLQKIFDPAPRIGFLAMAAQTGARLPEAREKLEAAARSGDAAAKAAAAAVVKKLDTVRFNNRLDAAVAGVFLALAGTIFALAAREWALLLAGRKAARLSETPPVWVDPPAGPARSAGALGAAALAIGLAKELAGEAGLERELARPSCAACGEAGEPDRAQAYVAFTTRRFSGVHRCC
jgi:carbon starvation protein